MKERKPYLDYIRLMAAFLVIYNHTPAYLQYMSADGLPRYLYMFAAIVTRINVPLFFMVSGVVLLGRREDISYVLKRRLPKYLTILLLLAAYYTATQEMPRVMASQSSLKNLLAFGKYVIAIFIGGGYINWFLYAYAGLLLMLPYLQRIAADFTKQDFLVLLGLHAFTKTVLPMVSMISPLSFPSYLSLPLATIDAFFYALAGYYLDRNVRDMKPMHFWLLGLLTLLGIGLCCACTTWQGLTTGVFTQDYVQLSAYVTTIFVFLLVKHLAARRQPRDVKALASLTFGIYLLDEFLRELLAGGYYFRTAQYPAILSSLGWCALSMTLCGSATWLLRKIPVLRKLL